MKNKKRWLIISFACIGIGIVILTAGRFLGGVPGFYVDSAGLHIYGEQAEIVRDAGELEPFDSIELDMDYVDVKLVASDRFAYDYCLPSGNGKPVCEVKDDRLVFKEKRHTEGWNFVSFGMGGFLTADEDTACYVKIEVPSDRKFQKLSFHVESGELILPAIQAEELEVDNEYGDVEITSYTGEKLRADMESGNLFAGSLEASQTKLESEYGEVEIQELHGGILTAKLESGGLRIDSLDVREAELTDEYGDIRLGLSGDIEKYGLDLLTEYGSICIDGEECRNEDSEARYKTMGSRDKNIKICCESGDIEVFQAK